MIRCLDIHTHHAPPQPLGIVSASPQEFRPLEGQMYSIGLHPWDVWDEPTPEQWSRLEKLAELPQVVAIGECGIDKLRGAPLFLQMIVFHRHILISEKVGKPLIIHNVKAHDQIVGLRKQLHPKQCWVVHGFRGKPTVAKMLTDAGIYLSFGEYFNADTLVEMPTEMILAETDESPRTIQQIIASLSASIGYDITERIAMNTSNFLRMGDINNLGAI